MSVKEPEFQLKIAETPAEIESAQRLRYRVFVEELGANGPEVNHALALEADQFDPFAEHLLLIDRSQDFNAGVVGTYRLLRDNRAKDAGGFYSEAEFDLTPLKQSGRKLLELGRSCVLAEYRGGTAMFELWAALAEYVMTQEIDVLFGVASFHGTDLNAMAQPLSHLHYNHLAQGDLSVAAKGETACAMNILAQSDVDRKAALMATPQLIKAYLRLGSAVGHGAWIDHAFNTTDVCMILDVAKMPARQKALYSKGRLAG